MRFIGVLAAALTIGAVSARCPLVGTYCGAGGATCCLPMVCVYDRGRNRCHHNCEGNAGLPQKPCTLYLGFRLLCRNLFRRSMSEIELVILSDLKRGRPGFDSPSERRIFLPFFLSKCRSASRK
ncbi:unnamed protein product [Zymoseptoria tritici ST99CH_1A5]|uniref:Hydrophobin n=1 Tax=Zymoseptoria tritici ST99CH_1A5 TaxID=1276529 RepID=A0A1Y6M0M2_ZYMTR|nr:unnamed protein product [Zymoseptoria tritici ST99CH_1A5]